MARDHSIDTEKAILDAAEQLFLEKGFAMTSTTEIARVAGCNQALVHYYYRSKDKLFDAVFARKAPLFFSAFFGPELDALPFEERMVRRIENHFDVLAANPRVPFLVINEVFTNPGRLDSLKASLRKILAASLKKMQRELDLEAAAGSIRRLDAMDFLLCLVSLNIGFFMTLPIYRAVLDPSEEDISIRMNRRKAENVEFALRFMRV